MRDQRRLFLGEVLLDHTPGGGVDPGVGDGRAPGLELGVEVVEVAEGPGQEEVLADVAVGPLHLALGLRPVRPARPWHRTVVIEEANQ